MDTIQRLLYRHAIGQCTADEKEQLRQWAEGNPARQAMLDRLADPEYIAGQLGKREIVPIDRPMAEMRRHIALSRRPRIRMMSIAASIVALFALASTYIIYNRHDVADNTPAPVAAASQSAPISIGEIQPGTTRARLISTSGEAINLTAIDTTRVASGMLASQNCAVTHAPELCLDVPRGGEFKITLEDSTQVWLNSESTLRYPEVFSPTERRVQVTGEAYFVVARDDSRPFYVETKEQTVRVYGTAFNIRAYADDPYVCTTLEHGSISITRRDRASGEVMLLPGHQARLDRTDCALDLRVVDPKVITGWRHGRFVFEEQPLSGIMRDLSRWYDFRYEFAEPELEQIVFMGSIPRYADFATAISIIEKSGGLSFTTEGDKVVISRK